MMNMSALEQHLQSASPWKAVVLYTDASTGAKAQHLLSRVAHQTRSEGSWQSSLWRFDVMSETPVAEAALERAVDAQLVLLSAESITEPPQWLLDWLESWADRRQGKDSVVAAWCHHEPHAAPGKGTESLRAFASRHGVSFICADDYREEATART